MAKLPIKIVLTDIEGTTTSISFVKDVLFPYAKIHTRSYLENTWELDQTKEIVNDLMELPHYSAYIRENNLVERDIASLTRFVNYLIDKDLKVAPLKTLQGLVWAKGYESGVLKGHVYNDVPEAFKNWKKAGLSIAIYSSGSVKAQKLLFGNTIFGDLLPYISAHFDTQVGPKQESTSYNTIAMQLDVPPADILFLTDIVPEADAARIAGMSTVLLNRNGNSPFTDDEKIAYTVMTDFESLKLTLK